MVLTMICVGVGFKAAKIFSTDYRTDPIYKKNVRELIERNKRFEENKE